MSTLKICFFFHESKILVHESTLQIVTTSNLPLIHCLYIGTFQDHLIYAGEVSTSAPLGTLWLDLKDLYGKVEEAFYLLAGTASQLLFWNRTHQFCGQCGTKTIDAEKERAKQCPSCLHMSFPKIAPVVMSLIQKEDQILLARGPHFPKGMYSVLAGFVDPGETLEDCVKREVFEEVGIVVDNIKYFGSQPWPFPSSLLIGFTCNWVSGEITKDPLEIEDALWCNKNNLPELPGTLSLARTLIDSILI